MTDTDRWRTWFCLMILTSLCTFPNQVNAAEGPALRIATVERKPFVIRSDRGLTGFSIELWNEISQQIGRTSQLETADTFSHMLDQVRNGSVDAAIANITVSAVREQEMDFSHPIFDSGVQVMVRADGSPTALLAAIFNWEMLVLVAAAAVALFAIANLMWFLERRKQSYFAYGYSEGLWRSFWWALNVILNGGFEERVPQTIAGRVFAVLLVVSSLFVVSAFVAKITSAVTVGELRSQIGSYSDLYGRRVGTTAGSTSALFLASHHIRHREFDDVEKLFEALRRKELDAVVHDAPILAHYASTEGRGEVRVIGAILRPEKYGIAFPSGSPLVESVNRALLRLREDGTYEVLREKWFGRL